MFAVMVLKETIAKVWLLYLTLPFLLLYATEPYVLHYRHPVTSLLLYHKLFHLFYVTASFSFIESVKHNSWFSHDITKIQTTKLSILPRFYFHYVLEQLKTNFHTNFLFKRILGFVIEYSLISKLLRDAAFT